MRSLSGHVRAKVYRSCGGVGVGWKATPSSRIDRRGGTRVHPPPSARQKPAANGGRRRPSGDFAARRAAENAADGLLRDRPHRHTATVDGGRASSSSPFTRRAEKFASEKNLRPIVLSVQKGNRASRIGIFYFLFRMNAVVTILFAPEAEWPLL